VTGGNGAVRGLSTDQLRAEVRAVLRDVLPDLTAQVRAETTTSGGDADVALRTDADLDAFVRRLAGLCEDPTQRRALQDGSRRFRLLPGGGTRPAPASGTAVVRVERGAVTERLVRKAAADGARVVVGRRAVLTPLARDKARSLGVTIEKEH
jgi:hypothetical protein